MDFRVEFTLAPGEIRAAMREFSGSGMRRGAVRLWAILGVVFLVAGALAALSVSRPSDLWETAVYVFVAWLVALPFVLAGVPRLAGRNIAPAFLERTQFSGNAESFSVARQTFSGTGSWRHFASWSELREFFVLAHAPWVLFLVPKRAMSSDQVTELRELLGRVLPP